MNLIKEYQAYIQDNPKGYWFKRKRHGWGWIPATKQGWLVWTVYILFVLGLSVLAKQFVVESQVFSHYVVPVLIATALWLLVTFRTGEPLLRKQKK